MENNEDELKEVLKQVVEEEKNTKSNGFVKSIISNVYTTFYHGFMIYCLVNRMPEETYKNGSGGMVDFVRLIFLAIRIYTSNCISLYRNGGN